MVYTITIESFADFLRFVEEHGRREAAALEATGEPEAAVFAFLSLAADCFLRRDERGLRELLTSFLEYFDDEPTMGSVN